MTNTKQLVALLSSIYIKPNQSYVRDYNIEQELLTQSIQNAYENNFIVVKLI